MLKIKCINHLDYIRQIINNEKEQIYTCVNCGELYISKSAYAPEGTKFIQYICRSCRIERRIPQNLRMNKLFYQYYDSNWNLLYEREAGPWPSN